MDVEVRDDPAASRYEVRVDGRPVGFLQYRLRGQRITFVHTRVDPEHAAEGLGTRLARTALDDARRRGLAVAPVCPVVIDFIGRHAAEYLDLVVPPLRARVTGAG
jgi:predicted GNAT family acetyltransferase